jgi:hypothetical protein
LPIARDPWLRERIILSQRRKGRKGATPVSDHRPRAFTLSTATLLLCQPQINSWEGNLLGFRAAVGVTPIGSNQQTFGVIWGTARTQVDRFPAKKSVDTPVVAGLRRKNDF